MQACGKAAGIGMIVGFVLPILVETGGWMGGTHTIWFWDMLDKAPGDLGFLLVLPLALGIATLVVIHQVEGRARSITLFSMGMGALLVTLSIVSSQRFFGDFGFRRAPFSMGSGVAAFFLLVLGCTALAAANRVRKFNLTHAAPRLLAGVGGSVILLSYVIPVSGGKALISAFGEDGSWRHGWPIMLVLAMGLTYGILGTCHFARGRTREGLCAATTLFGRLIIIGLPLSVLITVAIASDGKGMGMFLMIMMKSSLIIFGMLALTGVGIVGWMAHSISGTGTPLETKIRRAFDEPPPESDLKQRLARLKKALDDGLLTQAEYEAKRAQIIERTEF